VHGAGEFAGNFDHVGGGMAHGHAAATLGGPTEQLDVVAAVGHGHHPFPRDADSMRTRSIAVALFTPSEAMSSPIVVSGNGSVYP
jgi:hypothetical protein